MFIIDLTNPLTLILLLTATVLLTFLGKEIKAVCEDLFAATIITKLKAYNIPQYQTEIETQEQVFKLLFSN